MKEINKNKNIANKNAFYDNVRGFCPVCRKLVSADVLEKKNSMFIEKKCPKHGKSEAKIAKYAWYYKGLNNYYNNLYGKDFFKNKTVKNYYLAVTSKCNLNCPVCSVGALELKPDVSFLHIKKQLSKIRNGGFCVILTGGEPTCRKELPEIIKTITDSGNLTLMNTNGVRLANNVEYFKKLKKSGLKNIITWMETIKNPEILQRIRGGNFLYLKKKLFRNVEKLKIITRIIQVVIKGVDEEEINDCFKFARNNKFVNVFWPRGYLCLGGGNFLSDKEFLPDELVEVVSLQSEGLFSLEDFYYWQKIHMAISVLKGRAVCWFYSPFIFIPRGKERSLRETFNFKMFSKVLDEFEKIWQEDKKKAKEYFLSKYLPLLLKNRHFSEVLQRASTSRFGWDGFISKHYFMVLINQCPNLSTYNENFIKQQCIDYSLSAGPEKKISSCFRQIVLYSK